MVQRGGLALNGLRERLRLAQPTDLIFQAYVGFSGLVILLFGWKLSTGLWVGLILSHVALLAVGLWWASQPLRDRSLAGFLRDVYPLLFILFLYWELRYLALLFNDGYHDSRILGWEEALFGEQLAMTLSARFPYLWLSELMHFFYALYFLLLPLAAVLLYLRGRLQGLREFVYVELVVLFACYVVYMFYPVAGPHYEFPRIGGALAGGTFYQLVHWVLKDGGSMGAAFPSAHVAVAVAILLVSWRHDRVVWAVMLPLVVGLTIGTVYGRFHYGIDALGGVMAAFLLVAAARALRPWLEGFSLAAPGNSVKASPV